MLKDNILDREKKSYFSLSPLPKFQNLTNFETRKEIEKDLIDMYDVNFEEEFKKLDSPDFLCQKRYNCHGSK